RGSVEGTFGHWHIRLQRIAPGVFFALFGASVLLVSLIHSLNLESSGSLSYIQPATPSTVSEKRNQALGAVSAAIFMLDKPEIASVLSGDNATLLRVKDGLVAHRDTLIDEAYGQGW